jgi:hypothetical protein
MSRKPVFLVSIMRNECPYILEFVAHYHLLGFDRMFIATNDNTDRSLILFERLAGIGLIDCLPHSVPPDGNPQRNGYRLGFAAAKQAAKEFYVYPVDADEFLCLTEDATIHDYLDRFPEAHSICFNWRFYGSNGHQIRPTGLVMENYTYRCGDSHRANRTLKTLSLQDDNLRGFGPHFPHHFNIEKVTAIYSDGELLDPTRFRNGETHQSWASPDHGLAILRHYGLKSVEEYEIRRGRGSGKGQSDDRYRDEYFTLYDQNIAHDPVPEIWLTKVKTEMWRIFQEARLGEYFRPEYLGLVKS